LKLGFECTRSVDNVSLHKTFSTQLNFRHLFVFAWEALQMSKTWSCEPEIRGGRSQIFRLRSCYKSFESESESEISFKFENLTSVRKHQCNQNLAMFVLKQ